MSKYNFKNAVVYGGSHGGYLTTQLIGQFPDFYEAAATRNPVTHLEGLVNKNRLIRLNGLWYFGFLKRCYLALTYRTGLFARDLDNTNTT